MLLLMILIGGVTGMLIDLSALCRKGRAGIWQAVTDCVCCLLCGVLCAFALIFTGQKEMRLYGILGLMLGWLIYDLGLRNLGQSVLKGMRRALKKSQSASDNSRK